MKEMEIYTNMVLTLKCTSSEFFEIKETTSLIICIEHNFFLP
jgi:hypothetical protein